MTITSRVVLITPDLARTFLEKNTNNRSISKSRVAEYAQSMKSGNWSLNGESIIIDSNGTLVNGQHRLKACLESGCSFESFVIEGVAPESFQTIDTGKNRKASDVLDIAGIKNYVTASAGARFCVRTLAKQKVKVSNYQILDYVRENPGLSYWASRYAAIKPNVLPSAVCGLLHMMEKFHSKDVAETFFEKAILGTSLQNTDPEYLLRERFINMKRHNLMHIDIQHAFLIKAANARLKGEKVRILRMNEGEKFPEFYMGA